MAWFRMMGAESVAYHRMTVLGRADDYPGRALVYYGSRGETPLEWGGHLAARLGLAGAVSDEEYSAVYGEGGARDPGAGARLVSVTRPGVELVVAAQKSVAVLGVIGRADDMHAILDAETDATLAFLETWFERQGGRRGRAQLRTATSGLLWARTRHATSRAGDPNPHDHVLIANLSEMLDARGGWKALDAGGVRDLLHAATMAGRLAAAAVAVERGYAIVPDAGPSGRLDHWRIAGIPDQVCELFSKRSGDIDDALDDAAFDGPRARAIAARTTRAAKTDDNAESLCARWWGELETIGWPAERLVAHLDRTRREHRPLATLGGRDRRRLLRELVGPDGALTERKAFTRADIVRVAAPRLYGHRPADLDHVVADVIGDDEAIPLLGQPGARGRAWATASVIAREHAVAEVGAHLAAIQDRPAVRPSTIDDAIAAKEAAIGRRLTAGQRAAAKAICTSGAGLDLVVGVAGSGKTTALEVARTAFEAAGYRVLGAATSGQAARTLRDDAGVDSRTIASLAWCLEHETLRLDPGTVVFVDEAGMTSDTDLLELLMAAEASGAKVVAIGDHHQLGAIAPGGGLEALTHRHPEHVHVLDQNIRQHNPTERVALAALRAGDVAWAAAWYADNGRLHTAPTRAESLDQLVDAWAADHVAGHDTIMLAWRRRDVAALNQRARTHLQDIGQVATDETEIGGRRYAAGDRVVHLAPGGNRRYTTSQRSTIIHITPYTAVVRHDDNTYDVLGPDELAPDRLDHAYALTIHRTQGATVDTAHIYNDGGSRELAYVANSRARHATHLYTTAQTAEQAIEDLHSTWSREDRQRWVVDTDDILEAAGRPRPHLARRVEHPRTGAQLRTQGDVQRDTGGEDWRLARLDQEIHIHQTKVSRPPTPDVGVHR